MKLSKIVLASLSTAFILVQPAFAGNASEENPKRSSTSARPTSSRVGGNNSEQDYTPYTVEDLLRTPITAEMREKRRIRSANNWLVIKWADLRERAQNTQEGAHK